ncbi:MAG: YabP/YqfC family sporulation protein [bacterium]
MSKNIIKSISKSIESLYPEEITEIISDMPLITIVGNSKILIENFKNILEYSDSFIKLNTKIGKFQIEGSKMVLKELNKNKILIKGNLIKFEFDI